LLFELGFELLAQLDQEFDVQRRVVEPVDRQRPLGPVRRAVALFQRVAEQALDEGAEGDPVVARQSPGEFGVEQACRVQAEFGQARQILRGRVEDPLGAVEHVGEGFELAFERDGVDEHSAGAFAPELHQIGLGPVPIARGPLCVHRDRTLACGKFRACVSQCGHIGHYVGGAVSRLLQQDRCSRLR